MATVGDHLSVEELEERFVGCEDATASRHFQVIWLLARGHTVSQVSATTAFGERWIEQLLARYNAEGPEALGDLRRRNGATATILKPELLARLRDRLREPPADGGLWSRSKVAAWMASELGLTSVAPQRGWEALKAIGWSIQTPRPKNGLCITGDRGNLLVCFQRCVEGIFRGFARNLWARSRSGLEPHHPACARQCGMAWASQSQNPRWHSPDLSAAL